MHLNEALALFDAVGVKDAIPKLREALLNDRLWLDTDRNLYLRPPGWHVRVKSLVKNAE